MATVARCRIDDPMPGASQVGGVQQALGEVELRHFLGGVSTGMRSGLDDGPWPEPGVLA
jgi:hypothetical protein